MFRIKICGITRVEDALLAVQAGADAIGLNFFSGSPRYVGLELAIQIAERVPSGVRRVGIFVNARPDDVSEVRRRVGLDLVQLHGDEPPEWIEQFGRAPVMRAFRCAASGMNEVRQYVQRCEDLGHALTAVLLDAYQPGQYGGTGKTLDWKGLAPLKGLLGTTPVVLAGGLTPENVARAVRTAFPSAVDTASGVESAPGRKDAEKVRRFVAEASAAFALIRSSPIEPPS